MIGLIICMRLQVIKGIVNNLSSDVVDENTGVATYRLTIQGVSM